MNEIFIQSPRRQAFQIFKESLAQVMSKLGQSFDPDNALIMPFMVRVHAPFVNGKSNYALDLGVGTSNLLGVEKKLEKADIFMLQAIALGIQKYDPASPDFAEPIINYPDPTYHTNAVAVQLNKLYEGNTTLKVGTQTVIDRLDNNILKCVPNGNFAGTIASKTDLPEYGPSSEARGLHDLGSYPILLGENKNQLEINLAPGTIDVIAGSGATANNLVFLGFGWVYRGQAGNGAGQCSF